MRLAIFAFVNQEVMLAVVIINSRAQISLRGCQMAPIRGRVLGELFMLERFIRPDGAPVLPPVDALHKPLQIEGIDAGLNVPWLEQRECQINARVRGHDVSSYMA